MQRENWRKSVETKAKNTEAEEVRIVIDHSVTNA